MKDIIYKQHAIYTIDKYISGFDVIDAKFLDGLKTAKKLIKELPSAQPKRKMGHWKRDNTYHGDDTSGFLDPNWRCSECGGQAIINNWCMYDLTDFCPNCGADMRGAITHEK